MHAALQPYTEQTDLTYACFSATEYGGLCTFCGAQVALSYSEHSQTNPTSAATAQPSTQPVSANSLGEARPVGGPTSSAAEVCPLICWWANTHQCYVSAKVW